MKVVACKHFSVPFNEGGCLLASKVLLPAIQFVLSVRDKIALVTYVPYSPCAM